MSSDLRNDVGTKQQPGETSLYKYTYSVSHAVSGPTGLLRGAALANGAGRHDADDPAGPDLGAAGHLHPGSCLKDGDLNRARMNDAEACFILAARSYADKTAAVGT